MFHITIAFLALAAPASAAAPSTSPQGSNPPEYEPHNVGIFAPAANYFRLTLNPGVIGADPERRFHYGSRNIPWRTALPVAGDYNGNGLDTVAIFQTYDGKFFYANRNKYKTTDELNMVDYGLIGTHPIAGDFDGDGTDTFGVYDPSSGRFFIENLFTGTPDADFQLKDGAGNPLVGGVPVAGDFDGDGVHGVGLYFRTEGRFVLLETPPASGTGLLLTVDRDYGFGPVAASNEVPLFPVMGDWNSDGEETPGVYDARISTFLLVNAHGQLVEDESRTVETEAFDSWRPIAGYWSEQGTTGESSGYDWDTGDPASYGFDAHQLDQAYAAAAQLDFLHSLLVFRGDVLVKEEYFNGFDATMSNNVKSVSKSFLSALYGLAWADGHFTLHDTVSSHLGASYTFAGPVKPTITIDDIMTMRSGLEWVESNVGGQFHGSSDWVQYVLDQDIVSTPGTDYNYSTGNTHLGSRLLMEWVGAPSAYAEANLWTHLEISPLRWDRDPNGIDFGGSEVMMRPRDMGRFGLLYLNKGSIKKSDGTPVNVLDPAYVLASLAPIVPDETGAGHFYCHWWRYRTMTPSGYAVYYAWGYGGQFIIVIPELCFHAVATGKWNVDPAQAPLNANVVLDLFNNMIVPSAAPFAPCGSGD